MDQAFIILFYKMRNVIRNTNKIWDLECMNDNDKRSYPALPRERDNADNRNASILDSQRDLSVKQLPVFECSGVATS